MNRATKLFEYWVTRDDFNPYSPISRQLVFLTHFSQFYPRKLAFLSKNISKFIFDWFSSCRVSCLFYCARIVKSFPNSCTFFLVILNPGINFEIEWSQSWRTSVISTHRNRQVTWMQIITPKKEWTNTFITIESPE